MKYVANPVVVTAHVIKKIAHSLTMATFLYLDNDECVQVTPEMLCRFKLEVGDYWVQQEDGYEYLNPKEVFERKYRKMEE